MSWTIRIATLNKDKKEAHAIVKLSEILIHKIFENWPRHKDYIPKTISMRIAFFVKINMETWKSKARKFKLGGLKSQFVLIDLGGFLLTLTWPRPPSPLLASVSNPGTPPPPLVLTLYVYLPYRYIVFCTVHLRLKRSKFCLSANFEKLIWWLLSLTHILSILSSGKKGMWNTSLSHRLKWRCL